MATVTTSSPVTACTCGRLRRAARALTQLYDDLMVPSGLRITQFSLLRTLQRTGTLTMSELAEALLLDRTALSRTLDPLHERGLVAIAAGRDGRTREVALTRSGARAIRAALPYWNNAQTRVTAKIGAAKLGALVDTLKNIETLHPAHSDRAP